MNNNSNGGVIDENFNNFVSTILTPSTVNNEHGGGATTAGTNNFFGIYVKRTRLIERYSGKDI